MADNLDPDLQAKIDHFKSQVDLMKEVSLSERPQGELLAVSAETCPAYQMGSIKSLIGQAQDGETVLDDDASRLFQRSYLDQVPEGNHRQFDPQFTSISNQTGIEQAHLVFDKLSMGLGRGTEGVSTSTKRDIIATGMNEALAEAGVPEHLWPTYKHEINQLRAPYMTKAFDGPMFGTKDGDVSVAPGSTSRSWKYAVTA